MNEISDEKKDKAKSDVPRNRAVLGARKQTERSEDEGRAAF